MTSNDAATGSNQRFKALVLVLEQMEDALDAKLLILRIGQTERAFRDAKRSIAELEAALDALVQAAYRSEGRYLGPIAAIRDTEFRVRSKIARAREFVERRSTGARSG